MNRSIDKWFSTPVEEVREDTQIMVTLLSKWMLGEHVTPLRWAGVGLILIGTSLIVAEA